MGIRIGIFGGSFDPIHIGHLLVAELCAESLELDQVRFLIANVSPFKTDNQPASNKVRTDMVKLAIGGNPKFEIDTREIDRGGVSYTIDSVRSIVVENRDSKLYLLMGSDAIIDIAKWREPIELFKLVSPCVVSRGGVGEPQWVVLEPFIDAVRLGEAIKSKVIAPQVEVSSSDLRERVKRGKSIRYQVSPAVELFIRENGLYR
ncbi:MAG TPA: nicotinate-nucleotide adenylyltransferase [Pirellula sp.]|nr:nicotinate-nucleotide adenylyltransferase [Pirellula sp.]